MLPSLSSLTRRVHNNIQSQAHGNMVRQASQLGYEGNLFNFLDGDKQSACFSWRFLLGITCRDRIPFLYVMNVSIFSICKCFMNYFSQSNLKLQAERNNGCKRRCAGPRSSAHDGAAGWTPAHEARECLPPSESRSYTFSPTWSDAGNYTLQTFHHLLYPCMARDNMHQHNTFEVDPINSLHQEFSNVSWDEIHKD